MPKPKFSTPYSRAWEAFTESAVYEPTVERMMRDSGLERKYVENGIRNIFDAGWNAKTSLIMDVINQMADKEDDEK